MTPRSNTGAGRFGPAHGNAKAGGKTLVFESVPDGVRPIETPAAEPIDRDVAGRFTPAGAQAAARRRQELAKLPDFATRELEFVPFEGFAPFETGRRELLSVKATEMVNLHGFVSPGVMTVLRGWSWMIAFAEHAAVEAARDGIPDAQERARKFFKDASVELAKAWEIARVEAQARPRKDPHAALMAAFGQPSTPAYVAPAAPPPAVDASTPSDAPQVNVDATEGPTP